MRGSLDIAVVRPVRAEPNLLGEQRLRGVGAMAHYILATASVKGLGMAVGYEFIPLPSQGLDLGLSCLVRLSGVLEGLFEQLAPLFQASEFDLGTMEFGFGGVMVTSHGVQSAGCGRGTDGTTGTCTGTMGALCGMQLDTEVSALLLESLDGVGDGGEVPWGEGNVFVVGVGVVGGAEGTEGEGGAAEGEELDGGLVEVSEMEVGDREHGCSLPAAWDG